MLLTLITAASENNVIGNRGKLPWSLPADMKHFRELTRGHPVIMGRKTFDSIGRLLPERKNIVVTRDHGEDVHAKGAVAALSLQEAITLATAENPEAVFVIGGGELYAQGMLIADRIELTRVHTHINGDTFFPEIDPKIWEEVGSPERHEVDNEHKVAFSFITYKRRK